MAQESCFAFVINHLEPQFDLPLEIASNYFLRRANDEQIDEFRDYFNHLLGLTHYRTLSDLPYERSHTLCGENGPDTYALHPLERDQWKYYIINLESEELSKEKFVDLQLSSNISDIELVFDSFVFIHSKTSRTYYNYPDILQRFIEDKNLQPPQTIKQEGVQQIGTLYNLMKKTEKDYDFIKRSITLFDSLRNTPVRDDLKILGLFIVIESLITHRPGKTGTHDSLTQQISSKVPLISRRFKRDIKCSNFFASDDEKTIWKRLYKYRSKIAHGKGANLDGNLQILKNRSSIYSFLHKITKQLLVQSLEEPQLIDDLRQC